MQSIQQQFIEFALDANVLRFGEFKTKAGRLSPYFFNAGLFNTGALLDTLGRFYAETLLAARNEGRIEFDMIFGPAYKGIPLAASVATNLARLGCDVPWAFNRKEAKDHGEGGTIVGAPLKGKVQWRFAVDELIYSRTLDHWTTHRGIDISCAKGAEVHCPWNGKVEEIYEDDSLGITVRVSHSDGLESLYSNLRTGCPVKAGQRLNAGDLIGYVGETAVAECGDGAHLHFEVRKDGKSVDPAEYVTVTE